MGYLAIIAHLGGQTHGVWRGSGACSYTHYPSHAISREILGQLSINLVGMATDPKCFKRATRKNTRVNEPELGILGN